MERYYCDGCGKFRMIDTGHKFMDGSDGTVYCAKCGITIVGTTHSFYLNEIEPECVEQVKINDSHSWIKCKTNDNSDWLHWMCDKCKTKWYINATEAPPWAEFSCEENLMKNALI